MKQKFLFVVLSFFMLEAGAFAQSRQSSVYSQLPLIADDGIRTINVNGDIDVILIQERPDHESVKAETAMLNKLRITLKGSELTLSPERPLQNGERLRVYVWVDELDNLNLHGRALVLSSNVLRSGNLHISADETARVAVKTSSRVWFDSPGNFKVTREKDYYYVDVFADNGSGGKTE